MKKYLGLSMALLVGVLFRVFPHVYNLTPLLSMALFSGFIVNNKIEKCVVPIGAFFISDCILGFYSTFIFTYSAVLLIIFVGSLFRKHINLTTTLFLSLVSSLLFFIISNLGVWLSGGLYAYSLNGFVQCYLAAIPFLQHTLISSLFFSLLFYVVLQQHRHLIYSIRSCVGVYGESSWLAKK